MLKERVSKREKERTNKRIDKVEEKKERIKEMKRKGSNLKERKRKRE